MRTECRRIQRLVEAIVRGKAVIEVGSTAVRGVTGKQDLDFVVRVDAVDFAETTGTLDGHFNRRRRRRSRSDRAAFDIPSRFDATLHVIVAGSSDDNFETFTRALRDHRHLRFEYNELKLKWHGQAMEEYRRRKRHFIERVLGLAPAGCNPDGA
ncbi:GrpB family protein [Bradyrhizobium sp. McL0616]|uniref:GrpB family protein n=1 Tax=Bradyrhizobium sp. McL0616 TaxID=3415674 RepID=UPI003CEAC01B